MKTLGVITLILVVLIVFIALLVVIYKNFNGTLLNIKEKLDEARNEFNVKCKDKHELVIKFIKNIETKYKIESKSFEEVRNISEDEMTSVDTENLLNKCYKELIQIKEDNQKNKELKMFREIIDDFEDNELHIISLRTFYNKYAVKFNSLIKKFPYNIVCMVAKYETATILEGKEIDTEFINDMEV